MASVAAVSGGGFASSLGTAGGIASGLGGLFGGIGSLFGGSGNKRPKLPNQIDLLFPGFILGGGQLVRTSGDISRRQTELGGFTRSLRGGLQGIRSNLGELREELRPGFGRLSEIASRTIRQRGAQAVGNLRSQLQRRNVLGSSFASDAIGRVQTEFAQAEEQAQAQAVINEIAANLQIEGLDLETSNALLQQAQTEAALVSQQIQQELGELGIGASFFTQVRQGGSLSAIRQQLMGQALEELGLESAELQGSGITPGIFQTTTEKNAPTGILSTRAG